MNPSLKPVCLFESLDPMDVASAIKTNRDPLSRAVVRVSRLGLGYEQFLRWAIQDIDAASESAELGQEIRFSTGAMMNARRSLSCLADQYLLRDGFVSCRDVPREANDKADLLVRRGLFDGLAAQSLRRAVEQRNRIEHNYAQIALDDAQDTVHVIRATIETCVANSDPYWAPALFGSFLGGYSGSPEGETHWFHGWSGLLFVLARCDSPPWFGVVVPSSNTAATVRKVPLSELSCDQLLEALAALESQSSPSYSGYDERTFMAQLRWLG